MAYNSRLLFGNSILTLASGSKEVLNVNSLKLVNGSASDESYEFGSRVWFASSVGLSSGVRGSVRRRFVRDGVWLTRGYIACFGFSGLLEVV